MGSSKVKKNLKGLLAPLLQWKILQDDRPSARFAVSFFSSFLVYITMWILLMVFTGIPLHPLGLNIVTLLSLTVAVVHRLLNQY